jgi:cullin 1
MALKSAEQKDIQVLHLTINDDRKFLIQDAIVRIMKAEQRLKDALLMEAVIQQLSSRFPPKRPLIQVNFI